MPSLKCANCDADLRPGQAVCWLCGAEAAAGGRPDVAATSSRQAEHRSGLSYSLSTLLLVMTVAAIMCGLVAAAPGLGIVACILMAPVLVRTGMVVRRRQEAGQPVSAGEKAALMFGSFIVTSVICVVLAAASVGTFCAVCLGLAAAGGGASTMDGLIVFSGLVAFVVTGLLGVLMFKWVRRRYLRDVGEE